MDAQLNRRFVFAGGPGAGKTTVLNALEARGKKCVADTARSIIKQRLASSLSPRPAPVVFARAILDADIENYTNASAGGEKVFFDRGVIDALGMLASLGELSDAQLESHLQRYRYNTRVLLFPPWQGIYTTDAERDQTYDESVDVYQSVRRWYTRCGYRLVEVPIGPVEQRVQFVEHAVDSLG